MHGGWSGGFGTVCLGFGVDGWRKKQKYGTSRHRRRHVVSSLSHRHSSPRTFFLYASPTTTSTVANPKIQSSADSNDWTRLESHVEASLPLDSSTTWRWQTVTIYSQFPNRNVVANGGAMNATILPIFEAN